MGRWKKATPNAAPPPDSSRPPTTSRRRRAARRARAPAAADPHAPRLPEAEGPRRPKHAPSGAKRGHGGDARRGDARQGTPRAAACPRSDKKGTVLKARRRPWRRRLQAAPSTKCTSETTTWCSETKKMSDVRAFVNEARTDEPRSRGAPTGARPRGQPLGLGHARDVEPSGGPRPAGRRRLPRPADGRSNRTARARVDRRRAAELRAGTARPPRRGTRRRRPFVENRDETAGCRSGCGGREGREAARSGLPMPRPKPGSDAGNAGRRRGRTITFGDGRDGRGARNNREPLEERPDRRAAAARRAPPAPRRPPRRPPPPPPADALAVPHK